MWSEAWDKSGKIALSNDILTLAIFAEYCLIANFSTTFSHPKKDLTSKLAAWSKQVQSGFSGWAWKGKKEMKINETLLSSSSPPSHTHKFCTCTWKDYFLSLPPSLTRHILSLALPRSKETYKIVADFVDDHASSKTLIPGFNLQSTCL